MASLGGISLLNPLILSVSGAYTSTAEGAPLGGVSSLSVLNTDYIYLAGMVGQSLVAATGGEPIEAEPTGASGAFDTQKVTALIGQQIAAAVSAH